MKRTLFLLIALLVGILAVHAQHEVPADSLRSDANAAPLPVILPSNVKSHDGFLLDMGGLMKSVAPPAFSKFTLEIPDANKDYSRIFGLNPNVTYSKGFSQRFSLSPSSYYGSNPFGLTGFWGNSDPLQMGSFELKNGVRINTYGEYDKDGWKVPNRSALPWEKNNFKGAFEVKSPNGSFGIRIEVQQGRNTPY